MTHSCLCYFSDVMIFYYNFFKLENVFKENISGEMIREEIFGYFLITHCCGAITLLCLILWAHEALYNEHMMFFMHLLSHISAFSFSLKMMSVFYFYLGGTSTSSFDGSKELHRNLLNLTGLVEAIC